MAEVAATWYEQGIKDEEAAKEFTANLENSFSSNSTKGVRSRAGVKNTKIKLMDRDAYNKLFTDSLMKNVK